MPATLTTWVIATLFAVSLSGCVSSQSLPPVPAPPEAWSVSARCEPLSFAPGDYECSFTVKSLSSNDAIIVPSFCIPAVGQPVYHIPDRDSKGRTVIVAAARSKDSTVATWLLGIGQHGKPLLEYRGFVHLPPPRGPAARPPSPSGQ
jgi:hypothetical protein